MNTRNIKTFFVMISMIAIILACGVTSSGGGTDTAPATSAPATSAPASPPESSIQHTTVPIGLPAQRSSHAGDYDSSTTAARRTAAGGDRFTFERFERPFNANTMDTYFSQLDIVDTYVFQDDTWIYGTITLKGTDASNALSGKYALELDTDVDGKGDWLIVASDPAAVDWKVDGVQVFQDVNGDVGGDLPMLTDKNPAPGDGFEKLVFDQGTGNDPDSAWVRISPTDANTVEIAVKRSVLGDPQKYMINMWAGTSLLDPALFDFSDHFTHEKAGAADKALTVFYPIKSVFELDNSCRMAVGFQPTGKEPGLCEVLTPIVPGEPQSCNLTANTCPNGYDPVKCCCYAAAGAAFCN